MIQITEIHWQVAMGRCAKKLRAFLPSDCGCVGVTKTGNRFHEGLQHRFEVERRAADDLEHIGGGGLLLERFTRGSSDKLSAMKDGSQQSKVYEQGIVVMRSKKTASQTKAQSRKRKPAR